MIVNTKRVYFLNDRAGWMPKTYFLDEGSRRVLTKHDLQQAWQRTLRASTELSLFSSLAILMHQVIVTSFQQIRAGA